MSVTFDCSVTAPATPGTYHFQWRMSQDNLGWFGEISPLIIITVVAPEPDPSQELCFDPLRRKMVPCE
jgi:hypothetical protein